MPRKIKATTIYSLSRDLQVSPATISKALSGSTDVSAEVRQKVRKFAARKNFTPRVVIRKTPNICVLVQQYPGHALDFGMFLSTVMEGVSRYVQEEGLEMSIYADTIDRLNKCDIIRELRKRSIDGVVILRANDESEFLSKLEAEQFPHCVLLGTTSRYRKNVITVDNVEVGRAATRHLLEKKHRKIGVLVGPPHSDSGQGRLEGYLQELRSAGIASSKSLILHGTVEQNGLQFGFEGVRKLIERNPGMTAVFAMDHAVAVGALSGLRKLGRQVPRDVSVISCDDYPESAFLSPPLTVVDIPNSDLGYIAARQVFRSIRRLGWMAIPNQINLGGQLIERESTAVCRKR